MGRGPARPIKFHMMGRGPARPIKFSDDGLRPGPAHQISTRWAAARPGPSNFQNPRPGPVRPTKFSQLTLGPAWPGPSHFQFFSRPGPARPGASHFQLLGPARPGPARPITFSIFSAQPGPAHQIFENLGPARPGLVRATCPGFFHNQNKRYESYISIDTAFARTHVVVVKMQAPPASSIGTLTAVQQFVHLYMYVWCPVSSCGGPGLDDDITCSSFR